MILRAGGVPTQLRSKVALCHIQKDSSPPPPPPPPLPPRSLPLFCDGDARLQRPWHQPPPAAAMTDESRTGTSLQAETRGRRSSKTLRRSNTKEKHQRGFFSSPVQTGLKSQYKENRRNIMQHLK
ncbi:unnamed protein product [Pleuronectes platessa]|uniref:Uncharacterized protein n=1 Tax=Pleuronectes platessa TaxID=8262 RepID=A0A9N7VW32_PLEPL|nr:unnamed protein product [Pleuronectes platessa]